jgi:hypothetical protein
MEVEGRRGYAGVFAAECEDEVEKPLSLEEARSVGVCSSSCAERGKLAELWIMVLGDSFRRRKLGCRGREKLSIRGSGVCLSGVCRLSGELDLLPLFRARNRDASEGFLWRLLDSCGGAVKDLGAS